ncbi:MAG: hypothetical protein ISS66_19085 [Desulfobacteraceae bacterium]|nr:hypothetical protein [Desulfobacteraceae bacterium]
MIKVEKRDNRKVVLSELLGKPEYFQYERFRCTMMKVRCVERQDKRHRGWRNWCETGSFVSFPECQKCGQGYNIRAKLGQMGKADVRDMVPLPNGGLMPGLRRVGKTAFSQEYYPDVSQLERGNTVRQFTDRDRTGGL